MHLKKIPLAVLIGAAVAAPMAGAQSSVTVYGKLYPFMVNEKGTGATTTGTPVATLTNATPSGTNTLSGVTGQTAGNSRLGFRGREDMGGGLYAIFQLEGTVDVDAPVAYTFNRNTFVGLENQYGTIRLGQMDTVFKDYGDTIGMLGVSSGTFMSTSNILRKPGFGTSSAARFHERKANSIRYDSPKVGNVEAAVQVWTDELKTPTRNPRGISLGVSWDNGPLYLAIAHEIHYDSFGGSAQSPSSRRNNGANDPTNSKDRATQATIEWRMNKQHKFEFDVIRKTYNENATVNGRFQSYSNTAYQVVMENRWTDFFRTSAHYVRSNAGSCTLVNTACSTDGLAGSKIGFGAGYLLSRRTMLFAAVTKFTNGKSSRFSAPEISGNANPGEDVTTVGMGISHTF